MSTTTARVRGRLKAVTVIGSAALIGGLAVGAHALSSGGGAAPSAPAAVERADDGSGRAPQPGRDTAAGRSRRPGYSPPGASLAAAIAATSSGRARELEIPAVGSAALVSASVTPTESGGGTSRAAARAGVERFSVRAPVSASGEGLEAAVGSAARVTLFSSGPFAVYGKCFAATDTGEVAAKAFVGRAPSGSVLERIGASGAAPTVAPVGSGRGEGQALGHGTPEADRELGLEARAAAGSAAREGEGLYLPAAKLTAPDGEVLWIWVAKAARSGESSDPAAQDLLPDSCLWHGYHLRASR